MERENLVISAAGFPAHPPFAPGEVPGEGVLEAGTGRSDEAIAKRRERGIRIGIGLAMIGAVGAFTHAILLYPKTHEGVDRIAEIGHDAFGHIDDLEAEVAKYEHKRNTTPGSSTKTTIPAGDL
jgi:hypothetical protein